jgi:hypothetical protein
MNEVAKWTINWVNDVLKFDMILGEKWANIDISMS